MSSFVLLALLGAGIGLSLGLLGGGGSLLTVPALVYLAGLSAEQASTTSLVIVGVTALAAALRHGHAGRVALRAALPFAAASIPAALAGSLLSRGFPSGVLLVLFALVMLAAGVAMWQRRTAAIEDVVGRRSAPLWKVIVAGAGAGLLTGFFGVGGGFVIVPALTMVVGLPVTTAAGTSLAVIAIASAAGLVGRWGGGIAPGVTLAFVAGGVAGSQAGALLAGRLPERALRRGFALLVFALAAFLLVENRSVLAILA